MILVVAEQRQGKLNRASWEAIAAAQQAGGPVAVAVLGSGLDAAAQELAAAAVGEVLIVDAPALEEYTADGYIVALRAVIEQTSPTLVFFPHTYQTRDFAPALAARLGGRSSPTSWRSARRTAGSCSRGPCFRAS